MSRWSHLRLQCRWCVCIVLVMTKCAGFSLDTALLHGHGEARLRTPDRQLTPPLTRDLSPSVP